MRIIVNMQKLQHFQHTAKENKLTMEDKTKLTEHFIGTLPNLLLKVIYLVSALKFALRM